MPVVAELQPDGCPYCGNKYYRISWGAKDCYYCTSCQEYELVDKEVNENESICSNEITS